MFSLLIISAYDSYGQQTHQLTQIDVAKYLLTKSLDPDQVYMLDGHCIDATRLNNASSISFLEELQDSLYSSGLNFTLLLSWENTTQWILSPPPGRNQIAVSQPIGIAVNPLDIFPGSITIIVWEY